MKKNKLLDILVCLINLLAIVLNVYLGHPFIAMSVSLLFLLSQLLVFRDNFLREQRTKRLLLSLGRCEASSPEVFETIDIWRSQGMTVTEVLTALNRPLRANVPSPLEECQACRFWHGKNGIVCAVHPLGYQGDSCLDFFKMP